MQEMFNEVIRVTQGIDNPKTDELFDIWEKNKLRFVSKFGGLIYEYPKKVSFELDPKEKEYHIHNFVDLAKTVYNNKELADFVFTQREGFFENKTLCDARGTDGKIIKKGSKLVKAFSHFADGRSLFNLQNEASRIIQDNKMEGTLCFSVHPLDYLTISENDYNWNSCHSLSGDYRAGNLSYMMDKVTFICYLKGDADIELVPGVTWNNKKWRVLMYLDERGHILFTGKQYPFESVSGMDFILKKGLAVIAGNEQWVPWQRGISDKLPIAGMDADIQLKKNYIVYNSEIKGINDMVRDVEGSKQYNDVLRNNKYSVWYTYAYHTPIFNDKTILPKSATLPLEVGGMTYCLECGKAECLEGHATMMCLECEFKYGNSVGDIITVCDRCGDRILCENSYYVENECICENCFNELTSICDICNNSYFNDEITYDEEREQYICNTCMEDL